MTATVRDDYIELNGLRFHYRDWGDASATPLVLLHGYTGHARSWDSFAAAMSRPVAEHVEAYRVLALDQRGHGETGWTDDYSSPAMVDDVAAFVEAMQLGQFALLGLSMGGSNAYHFAARRPAGLTRLVIVDMGPEMVATGVTRIQTGVRSGDIFDSPEAAIAAARAGNARADERELHHRVRNNLMRTPDGRWTFRYDRALRSPDRARVVPEPDANWAAWRQIAVPTLIIRGGESDILGADVTQRMKEAIADCQVVEIPGSGHSIPLDAPAGFLAAVRTFL